MNKKRGQVSWISLVMLISLFLFKGVASAAMLCCGPDHGGHSEHQASQLSDHNLTDHSEHHDSSHQDPMSESSALPDEHQSTCSVCAISCTQALMLLDSLDLPTDHQQNERILSFTPTLYLLTDSGLERPPRFYS